MPIQKPMCWKDNWSSLHKVNHNLVELLSTISYWAHCIIWYNPFTLKKKKEVNFTCLYNTKNGQTEHKSTGAGKHIAQVKLRLPWNMENNWFNHHLFCRNIFSKYSYFSPWPVIISQETPLFFIFFLFFFWTSKNWV